MGNPTPLEKQLLQIDFIKGVNEIDRPETSEPCLTRVENLIQDQGGAYIKRAGTPKLGGVSTDDTGAALTSPTKLLRLKEGLGMVGNSGKFYHYMESLSRFIVKDELPDFVIAGADTVCSSGANNVAVIHATASSSKFHVIIHDIGVGVSNDNGFRAVVYDRQSGGVIKNIDLGTDLGAAFTTWKAVFVGDRYLHVYASAGAGIKGIVYDTGTAPIASVAAAISLVSAASTNIIDHDRTSDRSFVISRDGSSSTIYGMTNAGAAISSSACTFSATSMSVSGTNVWYVGATNKESRLTTNVATITNASAAHGLGSVGYIVANGSTLYNIRQAALTLGGATVNRITATGGASVNVTGWDIASAPFLDSGSGNVYVHVTKSLGLTVVAHAIANLSFASSNVDASLESYNSVRLAATLDPFLGVVNSYILKYFPVSSLEYCPAVAIQTVSRGFGYSVFSMKPFDHSKIATQVFGGENYISGGTHCIYGGNKIHEVGYVDMPVMDVAIGNGTGLTGVVKYIAVYRYVDETGAVSWSRTSAAGSVTLSNDDVDITIVPPALTLRDYELTGNPQPHLQSVELYRTKVGGTQYYLCASSQIGTPASGLSTQLLVLGSTGLFTVTDSIADNTLAVQPALFRQPGTANSAVDRYPAPSGNVICQHKDRLFTVDPYGIRVYYSSFHVDGETAWYNPVFSFFVHGGSGPITAMVSMDGRLFIFKRDGIFVVDGDGPAEGGVSGNEFSPPHRLATEYGCIDQRSMVVTTDGIVYRSSRGIELLNRSLQVKWIGDRVQTTVDANPKVCGACLDTSGRVRIALASADTGTAVQTATSGVELIWDTTSNGPMGCWTISHHTDGGGTYDRCVQDMCMANIYGIGETVCYADPTGSVCYSDIASGLDRGTYYIPWTVESNWIKVGVQARARISRGMLLAKKLTNHRMKLSAAFNYVDSYTQTSTWQPNIINAAGIEELELQLAKQNTLAVRMKFEENQPTDTGTYPITTGRGCDVLGIAFEIAPKAGAPKHASGEKG